MKKQLELALILILSIGLLTSCDIGAGLAYSPPFIPITVSIDSNQQLSVSGSYGVSTFIGRFEVVGDASTNISDFRETSGREGQPLLFVQVDEEMSVFNLPEGENFNVHFENNDAPYREVDLTHKPNGDIVLHLVSTNSGNPVEAIVVVNEPPSPTPLPASTWTPTPTPPPAPTWTPTPEPETNNPPPPPPPAPSYDGPRPPGRFGDIWGSLGGASGALGIPGELIADQNYAQQPFEGGKMIWWDNPNGSDPIWVLYNNGGWSGFEDNWTSAEPTYPSACPEAHEPNGPRNGFGKVWCNNAQVRSTLGSALQQESGSGDVFEKSILQWFGQGVIIYIPADQKIWTLTDNNWQQFDR